MRAQPSRSNRRPRTAPLLTALARIVAIGTSAMVILSTLVWLAGGLQPLPVSFGRTAVGVGGLIVAPICYVAIGAVLASRLPRNPIGWLFLGAGFALGTMLPVNLLVASAHETLRPASPLVVTIAWLRNTFATPVVVTALILACAIFPTGRPTSRRWMVGIWLPLLGGALLAIAAAADPEGMVSYPSIANPTAIPNHLAPLVFAARLVGVGALLGGVGLAIGALAVRYRGGDAALKAQLRWIMLAALLTAAAAVPFLLSRYVIVVSDAAGELFAAASQIGSVSFPIATAVAISRYRLFEIDVLLGRTLVYLPLMAILGGLYTASIAFFQRLFLQFTGERSDTAIVLTVLVLAAAFTPIRRALEGIVERRFPVPALRRGGRSTASTASAEHARARQPDRPRPPRTGRPAERRLRPSVLVPIEPGGTVACPLGGHPDVTSCLRCGYLQAVVRDPEPALVCAAPAPEPPPAVR